MSGIISSKRISGGQKSRREFLRNSSWGLVVAASTNSGLAAEPAVTAGDSSLENYAVALKDFLTVTLPTNWKPTDDSIDRPFDLEEHKAGNAVFKTGRFDIALERA